MTVVASSAVALKEKRLVTAFRAAGATSPDRATTMDALGAHEGLAFRILRRHEVLREVGGQHLYLDEANWEALRARRRRTAFIMLGVVVIAAIAAFLLALRR